MPVITIDGNTYEVAAGKNLLETCLELGLDLPYFCWHPAMGSIGACRQCALVQYQNPEDQRGRIVMGCMTPVTDGAIFSLQGDRAQTFREAIVESLMLNHPHDCPVCAEGGECHLQDMTVMVGHRDRHYRGRKNTHRNQYLGPLIHHEMNRCITCYRCTRYYRDYAGGTDLAAMAAHDHIYFGRHTEGVLESEFAGNLVEVCPTGVFTDKTLVSDYTRKWDLQSAPSLCTGCAVGCNTLPGERYGRLKRVHNRYNREVNGYFLCDRGRFGAGFVNDSKRLNTAGRRNSDGRYDAIEPADALSEMASACRGGKLAAVGSPRASVEANYLLRRLVGGDAFCPGFSAEEQVLVNHALDLQRGSPAATPDLPAIESADAILVLGEDPTHTAPRIALALRQSVRNRAYAMAAELKLEIWQDAAIRNLAQDQRSPLYIAAVGDTRLDDVAAARFSLAPGDIARLGFDVATAVAGSPAEGGSENAAEIAQALAGAERPLIVSGTGCGDIDVMSAAAGVAQALCEAGKPAMLCLTVPEANSLGQALLCGADAPSLTALAQRVEAGDVETLIVLENDLYRRGPAETINRLLDIPHLVVLDLLDGPTTSASTLALPAASFAEAEGTLVSLEGRAQRHFPVFQPREQRRPSWLWLRDCLRALALPDSEGLEHFDDISAACAAECPALAGITEAAPGHEFRLRGVRIPRQTHRYSGRTAMLADVSIHEPKQPEDTESPLAFTMEGLNRGQPGALLPYVWAPGWNSNQSLHKFQAEIGGALRGGTGGCRLLPAGGTGTAPGLTSASTTVPEPGCWQLVPRPQIFGSDELSAISPGVAELVAHGFIELRGEDATALGLREGDGVTVGDGLAVLALRVNESIAPGCAGYSAGLPGASGLTAGARVALGAAPDWRREPEVIGSDGGGHV